MKHQQNNAEFIEDNPIWLCLLWCLTWFTWGEF